MEKTRLLSSYKYYLLLALATLLVYWPMSLSVFSLKNDALVYFLPYRYQLSESIQHGQFPWWNPYLYTGLPMHSDMQSGVWNPLVMLISLFTRYNMTVLQWEMLIYLALAAIGMFRLVKELGNKDSTALIVGISYLCCGFITDSGSLVPWIASAAYIPFVFLYFSRILIRPVWPSALKLALALLLLLTAGYPSFFIFCTYLMVAATIIAIFTRRNRKYSVALGSHLLITVATLLLMSAPALISWIEYLPFYRRGGGTSLQEASTNAFPVFSSLSYLLPSAVSKSHSWIITDLSARNASPGIFIFLFFLLSFFYKGISGHRFILGGILFSFLFSLGPATPLHEWCYRFLPLMDSFRHPASMRLFTTIGIMLLAAPVLDRTLAGSVDHQKKTYLLTGIVFSTILLMLIYYFPHSNILAKMNEGLGKPLLDALTFGDMVVILALVQLLFLGVFGTIIRMKRTSYLSPLFILNSVLLCWIALPFTFFSQVRPSAINQYISSFPRGFPRPDLSLPVYAWEAPSGIAVSGKGYDLFYNKTIRIQDHLVSPTISLDYLTFLEDELLRRKLNQMPFVYVAKEPTDSISMVEIKADEIAVTRFSGNDFSIATRQAGEGTLFVFQQYHPRWKGTVDGRAVEIKKANKAFMRIDLPAGNRLVNFHYRPGGWLTLSLYLSVICLSLSLFYIAFISWKNKLRL